MVSDSKQGISNQWYERLFLARKGKSGRETVATARRAWLFADTPKGAKANAVLYTLVESARANDLNIYNYLAYLLTELPELDYAWLKDPHCWTSTCHGRKNFRRASG